VGRTEGEGWGEEEEERVGWEGVGKEDREKEGEGVEEGLLWDGVGVPVDKAVRVPWVGEEEGVVGAVGVVEGVLLPLVDGELEGLGERE
jgi:hypothetical protein